MSGMPFWVSAGFGNNGMSKMDIWVAEFVNSTSYNLYDMYSTSYLYPFMDTDIGGTYDFRNISYTNDNEYVTLSFNRDLYTEDSLDYEFTFVNNNYISLLSSPQFTLLITQICTWNH
jgi:hypothetical protein